MITFMSQGPVDCRVAGKVLAHEARTVALRRCCRWHLMAHLDEPIDVTTLAHMTKRSQLHFSRVFREARLGPAEIAASTGFVDQSHLSRSAR